MTTTAIQTTAGWIRVDQILAVRAIGDGVALDLAPPLADHLGSWTYAVAEGGISMERAEEIARFIWSDD